MSTKQTASPLLPLLILVGACSDVKDHDHDHDHNHGLTTALVLTFEPSGGGDALEFVWSDPDVVLSDASDYTLELTVLNELEDPVEDVTVEIEEESDVHQFFFTGSGVDGPATGDNPSALISHDYADEDTNGLPFGLRSDISTLALGSAELTVTLRHMPPEGDEDVKVAGLAEAVAEGGFAAIGGDNDIQITFPLTVE
jgi:hypothetical protein